MTDKKKLNCEKVKQANPTNAVCLKNETCAKIVFIFSLSHFESSRNLDMRKPSFFLFFVLITYVTFLSATSTWLT